MAEVGPLYEGQVLVLGSEAGATLITGKDSVDLSGPLELPITAQVLKGSGGKDQSTLLERLAVLLPNLRGGADYEGGSVKAPDGTALAVVGPRGKVLGGQWRFKPMGDTTAFTLELASLDQPSSANFKVEASGMVSVSGVTGNRFEYIYYSGGSENADWSLAVPFERVSPATAADVRLRMQQGCSTTIDRVLWLAAAGYTYDAWVLADRATADSAPGEIALCASLADRLAATLFTGTP